MKSSSFNLFQVQENMTPVLAGRNYGICIVNILKGIALSAETVLSIFSTSIISRSARKNVNRGLRIHVTDFRLIPIRQSHIYRLKLTGLGKWYNLYTHTSQWKQAYILLSVIDTGRIQQGDSRVGCWWNTWNQPLHSCIAYGSQACGCYFRKRTHTSLRQRMSVCQ